MRFAKGVLGVVVVISAVMVTALLGFAMNTTESIAEETRYERITDVTHLFDHAEIPDYIDYDPTENWTGFRTYGGQPTTGVSYETLPSGQSNLYPIPHETVGETMTFTFPDTINFNYGPITDPRRDTSFFLTNDDMIDAFDDSWTGYSGTASSNPTQSVINSWLQTMEYAINNMNLGQTLEYIDIDTGQSGIMINRLSDWTLAKWLGGMAGYRYNIYVASLGAVQSIDRVRVSMINGLVWAYSGETVEWISSTTETVVMFGGMHTTNGESDGSASLRPRTVVYTGIEGSTVEYVDISQGMRVSSGSIAFWNNNHDNSKISMLVHNPNTLTGSQQVTLQIWITGSHYTAMDWTDRINVTFRPGSVSVTSDIGSGRLGAFDTVMITLDEESSVIEMRPVAFVSFVDYTVSDAAVTVDMRATGNGAIQWLRLSNSVTAPRPVSFGIVKTNVFMNTYNAVIKDATMRISDFFPSYTDYRLQFNSFGLTGGSVLIGSEYYDVDGGKLDIGGTLYDLNLLTLDYHKTGNNAWTISIEGKRGAVTVEEGAPDAVGFYDGYWLFSSGLYRGETVTVTHHDVDLTGWAFDSDLAIAVYIGILILGTAIGTRIQTVGVLDLAVVASAAAFGWVLMGV